MAGMMPPIVAELTANVSEFKKKMGEASKETEKVKSQGSSHFNNLAKAGKFAFAGIAASALAFGAEAVHAAMEGEKAHAQLANAVKNTGGSMKALTPAIEEQTRKFAKLGFTNDELEGGLARLTQITGSTTKAMKDIGLAADLARAKHISLEQASTLVGKAANGNVTALGKMGVQVKDLAGKSDAGAIALQRLGKSVGGAAQAQAETFSGKVAALRAQFENLIEKVGNALIPKLEQLASAGVAVAAFLEKHRALALALAGVVGGALVTAMTAWIVKSAIAFGAGLLGNVKAASLAVQRLAVSIGTAETAMSLLSAGVIIGGIAAVGLAIFKLGQSSHISQSEIKDMGAALTELAHHQSSVSEALSVGKTNVGKLHDSLQTYLGDLKLVKIYQDEGKDTGFWRGAAGGDFEAARRNFNSLDKALAQMVRDGNPTAAADALAKVASSAHISQKELLKHGILNDYSKALKDLGASSTTTAEAQREQAVADLAVNGNTKTLAATLVGYKTAQDNATKAVDAYQTALDSLIDPDIAVRESTLDVQDAVKQLSQAMTEKISKDLSSAQKTEDVQRATDNLILTDKKHIADMVRAHQVGMSVNAQNNELISILNSQKDHALPGVRDQIQQTIDTLKQFRSKTVKVSADTHQADSAISNLQSKISGIWNSLKVQFQGDISGAGLRLHGALGAFRAAGGPVEAGRSYIVGEKQAEVFVPRTSGTIVPSTKGIGGTTINVGAININGADKDKQELARELRDELLKLKNSGFNLGFV